MISKKRVEELLYLMHKEEQQTREQAHDEYAHDDDNALANFERLSTLLGIPRERVLMVYLMKHIDGIAAHVKGHKSQREDVRGRIKDARVYLLLLRAMIEDSETTA